MTDRDPTAADAPGHRPVHPQVDLPALERDILGFWRDHKTFDRSLERTAAGPTWTFYEGPPTANGLPGVHHVEARVFKDLFPRFKTMQGYRVDRKAGWDCQGLHVEVGVEKELGLSGRPDIEKYGIAEFNAKCRESVFRHVDLFEQMTERMGFWIDLSQAYRTMDAEYIDSVWWSLKQIFDKGWLVEDYRVTPYCARCGTSLSDHELGQPGAYETVADPSVFVRFPLTSGPLAGQAALLTWTTTPWTLVSNALVAVHPDVDYVAASDGTETLVVAEALLESVLGEGWEVTDRFAGRDMQGWSYARPFELVEWPSERGHFVVNEDYVSTVEGTGLVHQSPAFGEPDFLSCRANDVPMVNPIDLAGRFLPDVGLVGGEFFKHADRKLVEDLEQRGLMFRHESYEHNYPHCWRCHTPVIYYAIPSWYIRTTQFKDRLLAANEATNWYPDSVKTGRYGDWLNNNVDWALSRTRYWGTPLPIWRCGEGGHLTCVGSRAELSELTGSDQSGLDPHRPFVDEVTFACPTCGGEARRVTEVIDAWYDSGSMPFAQWGYPYLDGSKEQFDRSFPAQFICEAIDQTRGWFYTLMAISTALFDQTAYENVVCVGLIVGEDGRKMSKHLGNILAPVPLMDAHGADALRWFMACSGSPWATRRVGHGVLEEIVRKVLLTYWNTVAFHALYARTAGWTPTAGAPPVGERPVLDRWLASRTQTLARDVTDALDNFDTQRAGALISTFVDELSNWYVRRSRRRFWDGDPSALATLHETIDVLTRLMAPVTPFVTERVWQDAVRPADPNAAESVHLASWPTVDESLLDADLVAQMELARRVVELGRAARAEAKVRTRQPLARALVGSAGWTRLPEALRDEVATELNVAAVDSLASAGADLIEHSAKANFRALGKRFGKNTPKVAAAIAEADAEALATALAESGSAEIDVDGRTESVGADEVVISERPREGWSVVNEQGETVALDLDLTPELVRAGLAREVIRLVQETRKASGFEVSDRVEMWWEADGDLATALTDHEATIADEVLATQVTQGKPADTALARQHDAELGLTIWLRRA
ncbi:MAG: isoleucine--tRNA ligase [Nocardioidaceae bacterium]